jgi:hypothetical protein
VLSLVIVLVCAGAVGVFDPTTVLARDGRVVRRGDCSGPSEWKLEVRREDAGRLRVKLEIEGGRSGQTWHVFLSDNGVGFFAGSRISGSGGRFEVERRTRDRAGNDTIRAGVNNVVSGETCSGKAKL